ncbi:SUKH-4 family immunity protein [Streptomyces fradiae]|uniref:SUKH-4 family immunity protein n=1 Tax=Streptomyces fradiae TaxID=1906 RepID=UPI0035145D51
MLSDEIPLTPDAEWLEARLGAGSLWRPDEAALPAELTDAGTRAFLSTVGFPAVALEPAGLDTRDLRGEHSMEPFDADELYGERYPDDDSPPTNFCFFIASWGDQNLMLDADGGITHYDPNGWDHAAGWKGPAADSLPRLAVLLGLIAEASGALEAEEDDDAREAAVTALRERLTGVDVNVGDSEFWDEVFESLL